MPLFDAWKRVAFDKQGNAVKHIWDEYLLKEKAVYTSILKEKTTRMEGTTAELAEKYRLSNIQMCAFFDGIHECVEGLPTVTEIEESTAIAFNIEFDKLFKQMVEYKAEALYTLPEWENIFPPEKQKELYTEQKRSHTVIRNEPKTGRNDSCPCNSGKKYKKCCGAA